jgi:uncharacterized protein YjbI with pentapeptide repeats
MLEVKESRIYVKAGDAVLKIINAVSREQQFAPKNSLLKSSPLLCTEAQARNTTLDLGIFSGMLCQLLRMEPQYETIDWARLKTMGIYPVTNDRTSNVRASLVKGLENENFSRITCDTDLTLSVTVGNNTTQKKIKRLTRSGIISANILNRLVVREGVIKFWAHEDSIVLCQTSESPHAYIGPGCDLSFGYLDTCELHHVKAKYFDITNSVIRGASFHESLVTQSAIESNLRCELSLLREVRARKGCTKIMYSFLDDITMYETENDHIFGYAYQTFINFCDLFRTSVKKATLNNVESSDSSLHRCILSGTTVQDSVIKESNVHGSDIERSTLDYCAVHGGTIVDQRLCHKLIEV